MNLPNKLTLARVVMIPLFVATFLMDGISDYLALAIFIIAGITDMLDGMIARKKNLVTDFGKLMDPLADKLMVMAVLICFVYAKLVHPAVVIVILSRELLVTGLRMLATSKGVVIAADFWGKFKTVSQDLGIIVILLWQSANEGVLKVPLGYASKLSIWIMTVLTVISAVHYCIKNKELFNNK